MNAPRSLSECRSILTTSDLCNGSSMSCCLSQAARQPFRLSLISWESQCTCEELDEGAEHGFEGPGSKSVNSVGEVFLHFRFRCHVALFLVKYPARCCCSALVESLLRYRLVVQQRIRRRIAASPTMQATNGMRNTGPIKRNKQK